MENIQLVQLWGILGTLLALAPGTHAGEGSKMADFWTLQVPFVEVSGYLFDADYTEKLSCIADLNPNSDTLTCSMGYDAKTKVRAAALVRGDYDRAGGYLEANECYVDDGAPVQQNPDNVTALLRMQDKSSMIIYAGISLNPMGETDTWKDKLESNITKSEFKPGSEILAASALSMCHIRWGSCYESLAMDENGKKLTVDWPCAEFAGKWNTTYEREEDGDVTTEMACCRGVTTGLTTVTCSYGTMHTQGYITGKVSAFGQLVVGDWYELTVPAGQSDTIVGPNGTCASGGVTWVHIGWPDTFFGHRTSGGLLSALASFVGDEGLPWYGQKHAVDSYPPPPSKPPCLIKEMCRDDLAWDCARHVQVMITCVGRANALMTLILTVVGITSAICCVLCSYVCYMRRCAPGAPGINLVCAKKVEDDDEDDRI